MMSSGGSITRRGRPLVSQLKQNIMGYYNAKDDAQIKGLNPDQRLDRTNIPLAEEEQMELQMNESVLHSALQPMPELSIDQVEASMN